MRKFFDLTHPFWRMMALLSDFMTLSILWFFASLPIITFIPATIALFSVGYKLNFQSSNQIIREFIDAFLRNFKFHFFLGCVLLLLAIIIGVDVWYYHSISNSVATFWLFVFLFIGVVFLCLMLYFLPLIALYDWNLKNYLIQSFVLMVKHAPWTLFLFTVNGAILFMTAYVAPYLVFFSIGGIGYLNTKVMIMLLEKKETPIHDNI